VILLLAIVVAAQLWGVSTLFALFTGRPEPRHRLWAAAVSILIFFSLI